MDKDFKIALITLPEFVDGEADVINELMEDGLQLLHVRKPLPQFTGEILSERHRERVRGLIEGVDKRYRKRMTMHYDVDMAKEMGLGGVHVRLGVKDEGLEFKDGLRLSCSCHSIEEAKEAEKRGMEYFFLSPIFDSVSKVGYKSAFDVRILEEMKWNGVINEKVFALGGVTKENVKMLMDMGFGGCGVIGSVWGDGKNRKKIVDRFAELRESSTFAAG